MFNQYNNYTLEKEFRNKQSAFMTETAQLELLNELNRTKKGEVSSRYLLRYFVGKTMIKIGESLTRTPQLKEV